MANIGAIEILLLVTIIALVAALLMMAPADEPVDRWLTAFDAPADEESRRVARRTLTRAKRWRFGGAFAAIVGYSLLSSRSDLPVWVNTLVIGLAGYLVGAIAAEVFRARPRRDKPGAMLAPRTLTAYVNRIAIVGLVATPAAGVALAWLYRTIERDLPRRFHLEGPATVAGAAASGVVVAVVTFAALHALVRRPQPTPSVEGLVLDDALRSSSAHALAGATLALQFLLLTSVLSACQNALSVSHSRFATFVALLSFASLAAALASWAIIGHPSRWRTRRPRPARMPG